MKASSQRRASAAARPHRLRTATWQNWLRTVVWQPPMAAMTNIARHCLVLCHYCCKKYSTSAIPLCTLALLSTELGQQLYKTCDAHFPAPPHSHDNYFCQTHYMAGVGQWFVNAQPTECRDAANDARGWPDLSPAFAHEKRVPESIESHFKRTGEQETRVHDDRRTIANDTLGLHWVAQLP